MERDGKRRVMDITATHEGKEGKEEQDHEDEEVKIEKFFAILNRLKESRTWIKNSLHKLEVSNKKDAKRLKVHGPSWTPVFEVEDFAGQKKDDNANIHKMASVKNEISKGRKEEKEDNGLDLNLTL